MSFEKHFYNEPLGGVLKYENMCVKDTFDKNLKTKGHGIDIWLSTPMLIDVHTKEKVQYLPFDSFNEISHSFTYSYLALVVIQTLPCTTSSPWQGYRMSCCQVSRHTNKSSFVSSRGGQPHQAQKHFFTLIIFNSK